MENWRPKMAIDSIEKQKRRSDLKDGDKQTDRVNDKNNRLLARRGDQQYDVK